MSRLNRAISRRTLTKALGLGSGLAGLLPPLSAFGAPGDVPKRLIFICTPQGTVREKWLPTFANGQLTLSPILSPLETVKSKLFVIDGLRYASSIEKGDEKGGHYSGMSDAITGRGNQYLDPNEPEKKAVALGISLDQYLAPSLSAGLAHRSLQLSIETEFIPGLAGICYSAAKQPLFPENDPVKIWKSVFESATLGGGTVDPKVEARKANRKSILDLVRKDLKRLSPALGKDDRNRLDAHLNSVEELDMALSTKPPATTLDFCKKPAKPPQLKVEAYSGNDNIPQISRLQIDLLVMAMACDLTRVGSLQYGRAGAQHRFTWLGPEFNSDPDNGPNDQTQGIHGLAHNENTPTSRALLARCHQWYSGEVKYLIDKLSTIPEGNGFMIDNTLVVWVNEMGTGSHSIENIPIVLAGNVGGYFKPGGRLISAPKQPHNRLLLSIAQAFGKNDTTFGDPDFCPGPLAGLV